MKLALPKGRLLQASKALLQKAGIELAGYDQGSRLYRPSFTNFPALTAKVFQEKDIPIQVAVGNYDLGICGLDWVEELISKYPRSALVKVRDLGYGERKLCAAASRSWGISSLDEIRNSPDLIRIASEYSNLAESLALSLRLRRFKVFPLWGAAEAYPPEGADVVLTLQACPSVLSDRDLIPLATILRSTAFLIANRNSWESQDMSALIHPICACRLTDVEESALGGELEAEDDRGGAAAADFSSGSLRLALPDGHQQQPAAEFLARAGIKVWGYTDHSRRPVLGLEGVAAKVVRPQDMPLQVANGNFDLAITGRDWLCDHLYRFPTSPVQELLDMGFGRVRIVAVVSRQMAVSNVQQLRSMLTQGRLPSLRVASEYINIADKYARDNHLSPCRLIPTWGASEAFLPEDADLLIENTQTGRTLAQHGLEIIDVLFESSACLIGRTGSARQQRIASFIEMMKRGIQG